MKIFLAILILIFSLQSLTKADDISDFEIEGISLGDNLQDHFTEKEIKNALDNPTYYPNPKYKIILFEKEYFQIYEGVQIHFQSKDKKIIVYGIDGNLYFEEDMSKCYEKKDQIIASLEAMFTDTSSYTQKKNHSADKTGNSKIAQTVFPFKNDEAIIVSCTDWSEKLNSKGWTDELKVTIISNTLGDFINNEAYK
tara:strand:+ start:192 stop:779 length:588 start_codon:yes stop_codon:yes gene_type:complete